MPGSDIHDLLSGAALDDALRDIVVDAERVLAGVDAAGIAVHKGGLPTRAASNALAVEADDAQYRIGHGPCLQAFHTDVLVVLHLGTEDRRWLPFQVVALRCGARTVLSVPLHLNGSTIGSLNLYSRASHGFPMRAVRQAELFARPAARRLSQGGTAMHAVETAEVAGLELQDRDLIERALGVLMAAHADGSVSRARKRLRRVAAELDLEVPRAAARILAAPPRAGAGTVA